jgi:hypothetical protein
VEEARRSRHASKGQENYELEGEATTMVVEDEAREQNRASHDADMEVSLLAKPARWDVGRRRTRQS